MLLDQSVFQYAPMLKWKQGEYTALGSLPAYIKARICPIFLMPPPGSFDHEAGKILTPGEHIKRFSTALEANWSGCMAFVDASKVDTEEYRQACRGVHPLTALLERSRLSKHKAYCAPVTGLNRSAEYQTAVREFAARNPHMPICVRIDLAAIDTPEQDASLRTLLKQLQVSPDRIVLSVEATGFDLSEVEEFSELAVDTLNRLPRLYDWHSIVLNLTALPTDVKVKANQTKKFQRHDWAVYLALHRHFMDRKLLRLPVYSDFGIDAATFMPAAPVSPSAQLRYSTPESYIIAKGLNTRVGGYEAIYSVAESIVQSEWYMGENFSAGSSDIAALAARASGTGNAATWKKMGFNHHFTLVDLLLCELFDRPPGGGAAAIVVEEQQELL